MLSVRFGEVEGGSSTPHDLLVLASGERYRVQVKPGVKARLVCTGGGTLDGKNAIPFADLRAWVPRPPPAIASPPGADEPGDVEEEPQASRDPETIAEELLDLKNDRDVVQLWSGDRMTGVVESVGPTEVVVSAKVGRVKVKREKIRGIAFSKTFKPYRDPPGLLAEARLNDGSIVLGQISGSANGVFSLRSALGAVWKVSGKSVRKVVFRGGKLVWLSDVTAAKTSTSGFFNRTWEPRMNRSVWGNPLTVDGTVYEHGIGCHARTELEYHLDGKYVMFVSGIGIDDETKGAGAALFSITGDGRPLLKPVEMKGRQKPRRIKLSVAGIRRLTLTVDFGKDQDFGDHADWLDARLIRK